MRTLYMASSHPHFSLADEILVTVPPEPAYAEMNDMCADFGLLNQRMIYHAIEKLLVAGIVIETKNLGHGGGRIAFVEDSCWLQARRRATEYWDKVYGKAG